MQTHCESGADRSASAVFYGHVTQARPRIRERAQDQPHPPVGPDYETPHPGASEAEPPLEHAFSGALERIQTFVGDRLLILEEREDIAYEIDELLRCQGYTALADDLDQHIPHLALSRFIRNLKSPVPINADVLRGAGSENTDLVRRGFERLRKTILISIQQQAARARGSSPSPEPKSESEMRDWRISFLVDHTIPLPIRKANLDSSRAIVALHALARAGITSFGSVITRHELSVLWDTGSLQTLRLTSLDFDVASLREITLEAEEKFGDSVRADHERDEKNINRLFEVRGPSDVPMDANREQ